MEPRAQLEGHRREDRRDRPPHDRPGARRDLARALDRRRRPEPRRVRDRRGRREADLHDEPVRLRPAAGPQRPLRRGRLGRHRRGPRLVLRAQGLPALLHPLRVHERARADQLDRLPGLPVAAARGLREGPVRLALVQGPGRHPRASTGSATGSSATAAEPELVEGVRSVLAGHFKGDPGELRAEPDPGRRLARDLARRREAARSEPEIPLCVLRRDPEGSVSLVPMREEFALLERSREAGVPVPEPIAFEDAGGAFGSPGILMEFVEGTSVAPRILRKPEYEAARGRLPAQLAEALARVHSIGPGRRRGRAARARPATRSSPRSTSGSARSTRSASRCRPSSSACAGCGRTRPSRSSRGWSTATTGSATSSSTRTASPPSSTGSSPTSAIRPRTSAGSASARGGSATTTAPSRASATSTSSSPPTRRRAVRRSTPSASATGRLRQRQVGGDLRPPGGRPPRAASAAATSSPRSAAASASRSGTCSQLIRSDPR